jgi:hypothetical protein
MPSRRPWNDSASSSWENPACACGRRRKANRPGRPALRPAGIRSFRKRSQDRLNARSERGHDDPRSSIIAAASFLIASLPAQAFFMTLHSLRVCQLCASADHSGTATNPAHITTVMASNPIVPEMMTCCRVSGLFRRDSRFVISGKADFSGAGSNRIFIAHDIVC